MKRMKLSETGLSLVELMIALVLGSLISAAAIQMLVTNKTTMSSQQGGNEVEENGRFALDVIMRDLRKAGMRPTTTTTEITTPIGVSDGSGNTGDSITVTYVADSSDTNVPPTDCNGNSLSGTNPTVINRYYVSSGQLMCLGNGSATAAVLADGIDVFQIIYGVDGTVNDKLAVTQWKSAPAATETIVAVRIGMMLHSDMVYPNPPTPSSVNVLGQVTLAANSSTLTDGRIHRLFIESTLLRNNLDPDTSTF